MNLYTYCLRCYLVHPFLDDHPQALTHLWRLSPTAITSLSTWSPSWRKSLALGDLWVLNYNFCAYLACYTFIFNHEYHLHPGLSLIICMYFFCACAGDHCPYNCCIGYPKASVICRALQVFWRRRGGVYSASGPIHSRQWGATVWRSTHFRGNHTHYGYWGAGDAYLQCGQCYGE